MDYVRFRIDGAVPKPDYDALPAATKTAIRDKILQLKALCRKINEGKPNEEATIKFTYHICKHETPDAGPCNPQDI